LAISIGRPSKNIAIDKLNKVGVRKRAVALLELGRSCELIGDSDERLAAIGLRSPVLRKNAR